MMVAPALALISALTLGSPEPLDLRRWTAADTALQATFLLVTAVDWAQTRSAHVGYEGPDYPYEETNPFLGKHPSALRIDSMIAASMVGHTLVAYLLPKPYRTLWQLGWITVESATVVKNHYSAGVRIRW